MATVNVRYMVKDVEAAVAWYAKHLGFTLLSSQAPAFADISRGSLRLLLSGPSSSAGRPMPDGERPGPGGWNRIHLIVEDHDLRPLAIPLLVISMMHLGLIVFRYVFTLANSAYLVTDLIFFGVMGSFGYLMLAHIGLLAPLRKQLTNYFDRNSRVIRTED